MNLLSRDENSKEPIAGRNESVGTKPTSQSQRKRQNIASIKQRFFYGLKT